MSKRIWEEQSCLFKNYTFSFFQIEIDQYEINTKYILALYQLFYNIKM